MEFQGIRGSGDIAKVSFRGSTGTVHCFICKCYSVIVTHVTYQETLTVFIVYIICNVSFQDQWIGDGSLSKISGNFGLWRVCVDR